MSTGALEQINLGIVGAAGRRGNPRRYSTRLDLRQMCDLLESVRIHAVCDVDADGLDEAKVQLGASEAYISYDEMLEASEIDAVFIGTPMPYHVPQAIAALEKGIHVLSEVPAGISVEECRRLVGACQRSSAIYMMGENFAYTRPNQMVKEIVRRGLLGTLYYAEGEYLHDLKRRNEVTRWRRTWQTGINGVTYGTHSLGPVLQWMAGDRVVRVCSAGSGHHYIDPRGNEYENEDTCVMLCAMSSGALVKVRVDMISERPHAMMNYQLQGTDGCYESARAPGEADRIWLRSRSKDGQTWLDLSELADEFLPDSWRRYGKAASNAGHAGADLLELVDFVEVVRSGATPEIGVHEAMDMTLPGLMSQESIAQGGQWLDVPDSRDWVAK